MWYLTNKNTGNVYYLVAQPAGHTVGRARTDLVIQDDDSISRQHALLQPDKDGLILTDTGSRYGTYVDKDSVKSANVHNGDTVQFGRCGSIWIVGRVNFHCLTSTLTMGNELKAVLEKLEAQLLSSYVDSVTHLIMPTITVTTKLLLCLVGQVAVVSPEYFTAVNASIARGSALPAVTDFIPTCTESDIKNDPHMFQPNPARSNLFQGKEFIFFNTAQCRQYEDIVKLAGGVCLCAQREKIAKSRFVKPNVITIKPNGFPSSSQSLSQSLDSLDKQLSARGLRMIPDVEIGLAILYGSVEKYCNPAYNFASNVEVCEVREPDATENILAKNSMNLDACDGRKKIPLEMNTIPETEPNSERSEKPTTSGGTMENTTAGSIRSSPSVSLGSALSAPKPITPIVPSSSQIAPRRSKRFPENLETNEIQNVRETDKDSFQESKRPRRSTAVSPTRSIVSTKPTELPKERVDLISTNPSTTAQSKLVPSGAVPAQVASSSSFQAVQRNPQTASIETTATATNSRPASRRRANQRQGGDDDDDMFNFGDSAPRKKPRTTASSLSKALPAPTTNDDRALSGTERSSNADEDDLFSLDENLPSQRQRGSNRRTASATPHSTAAGATAPVASIGGRNDVSSNSSKDSPHSTAASLRSSSILSNSLSARYREFMKPIAPSTAGWLSSSFGSLKLESNGDDQSAVRVKVKQESPDTVDSVAEADNKRWITGMSNIFQVQEMSLNRGVRLSVTRDEERPRSEQSGLLQPVNFKTFAKKHPCHRIQQTSFALKLVCALDESQAA